MCSNLESATSLANDKIIYRISHKFLAYSKKNGSDQRVCVLKRTLDREQYYEVISWL